MCALLELVIGYRIELKASRSYRPMAICHTCLTRDGRLRLGGSLPRPTHGHSSSADTHATALLRRQQTTNLNAGIERYLLSMSFLNKYMTLMYLHCPSMSNVMSSGVCQSRTNEEFHPDKSAVLKRPLKHSLPPNATELGTVTLKRIACPSALILQFEVTRT